MYADRYVDARGFKPGSLAAAVAINGGLVAALLFAGPVIQKVLPNDTLEVTNVFRTPPPEPEPIPPEADPLPRQDVRPQPQIDTTKAILPGEDVFVLPRPEPIPLDPSPLPGTGELPRAEPSPIPPVLVDASVDPRFAGALQPPYPPSEQRAGASGRVVVRVLIGVDGRVKQAERVSAASDAFWRATERQALSRWRFRPATRDGIPVESWRTMTVRFEIPA